MSTVDKGNTNKMYQILIKQGKIKLISQLLTNPDDFEHTIMNANYWLTPLDLWLLASKLNLPIVIFTENKFKNLDNNMGRWVVLAGEPNNDKYYFVRCTGDIIKAGTIENYNLIVPAFALTDVNEPLQLNSFDEFIQNYTITIARPNNIERAGDVA